MVIKSSTGHMVSKRQGVINSSRGHRIPRRQEVINSSTGHRISILQKTRSDQFKYRPQDLQKTRSDQSMKTQHDVQRTRDLKLPPLWSLAYLSIVGFPYGERLSSLYFKTMWKLLFILYLSVHLLKCTIETLITDE